MTIQIPPPFIATQALVATLKTTGYAALNPVSALQLLGCTSQDATAWLPSWNDLPPTTSVAQTNRSSSLTIHRTVRTRKSQRSLVAVAVMMDIQLFQ